MDNVTTQTQQVVSPLSGHQPALQNALLKLNATGLDNTSVNFLDFLTSVLGNGGEAALAEQLKKSAETLGTQMNAEMLAVNPLLGLMLAGQGAQTDSDATQQAALLDAHAPVQSLNANTDVPLAPELLAQLQQTAAAAEPPGTNTAEAPALSAALQIAASGSAAAAITVTPASADTSVLQGQTQFERAVSQAQQLLKATDAADSADTLQIDFDELQKKVDSGVFLPRLSGMGSTGTFSTIAENSSLPDAQEILSQIKTAVTRHEQEGITDFTMKLSPEGLGEITVKLLAEGGKTTLSLMASDANVQRLLGSELNNLRDIMRPYNVEVAQVVETNAAQNMNMQQFGQQFSQHSYTGQQQNSAFYSYGTAAYDESAAGSEQPQTVILPDSVLDAYI